MRRPVKKRNQAKPDAKFNSTRVTKFINHVMLDGKKGAATGIVYGAFDIVKEKTKADPNEVFEKALQNVGPTMEVRSKRVGGANYQVPREVRPERRTFLAMKWILDTARNGKGKPMQDRLAAELIAAYNGEGEAVKKRENVHKMADANKAFAHFAV
jgi:small subunit ribosomal protein S7